MAEATASDAIVLIPGIMGSELRDGEGKVVWGLRPKVLFRQLRTGDVISRLRLPPGAPDDGVHATGLLSFPCYLPILDGLEPYTNLLRTLCNTAVHPSAVVPFPYDWRRSVAFNARVLEEVALAHLDAWTRRVRTLPGHDPRQPAPKLSLVCHSMGGLIARHFTEVLGHRDITRRVVTLGTPFGGSMKALRLIADGDVLPLGVLADEVRRAARTFPGVYDLLPRYPCVRTTALDPLSGAVAATLGAEPELFEAAARDHRAVLAAAQAAGAAACPIRPMVGVTQPTLASVAVNHGEADFDERLADDIPRGGDSTVGRDHAHPSSSTPSYLPQRHGKIATTAEAVAFVRSVLTEVELGAYQGEGIGLRLPDTARVHRPFDVGVESTGGGLRTCRLIDAESGRQVDVKTPLRREGRLVATFTARQPGLYRVAASGGGFSPVEELLLVLE